MFHWILVFLEVNYETAYWDAVQQSDQWAKVLTKLIKEQSK